MMDLCNADGWSTTFECGPWDGGMLFLYLSSHLGIFVAYAAIFVLVFRLRKSNRFLLDSNRLSILFVLFIATCGIGHASDAFGGLITHIWGVPWYYISTSINVLTWSVSTLTVLELWNRMPAIMQTASRSEIDHMFEQKKNLRDFLVKYKEDIDSGCGE